jgi:hypothetical protein
MEPKTIRVKRKYEKTMQDIMNPQQASDASEDDEDPVGDESKQAEGLDGDDNEKFPHLIGV